MPIVGQISFLPFDPSDPTRTLADPTAKWAPCDGKSVSIVDYPALFTVIGTTWGGDGKTAFNLPDLRGLTMIGVSSQDALGAVGGLAEVVLDSDTMPPHDHALGAIAGPGDSNLASDRLFAQPVAADGKTAINVYAPAAPLVALAEGSVQSGGGGAGHDNMQPYLALDAYIALTGVFPSRPPA